MSGRMGQDEREEDVVGDLANRLDLPLVDMLIGEAFSDL